MPAASSPPSLVRGARPGGYVRHLNPSLIRSPTAMLTPVEHIAELLIEPMLGRESPPSLDVQAAVEEELRCLRQELVAARSATNASTKDSANVNVMQRAVWSLSVVASLSVVSQTCAGLTKPILHADLLHWLTKLAAAASSSPDCDRMDTEESQEASLGAETGDSQRTLDGAIRLSAFWHEEATDPYSEGPNPIPPQTLPHLPLRSTTYISPTTAASLRRVLYAFMNPTGGLADDAHAWQPSTRTLCGVIAAGDLVGLSRFAQLAAITDLLNADSPQREHESDDRTLACQLMVRAVRAGLSDWLSFNTTVAAMAKAFRPLPPQTSASRLPDPLMRRVLGP